jgi:hypothetical protein
MPVTRESIIQHLYSTYASSQPDATLELGEIAINVADEALFIKNTSGTVKKLSATTDLTENLVTIATTQTIVGEKIFDGAVTANNTLTVIGDIFATFAEFSSVTSTGNIDADGAITGSSTVAAGGQLRATSGTASTSTTTGALLVTGGIGVSGALFVGGTGNFAGVLTAAATTASSNSTTGALVVSGGIGVAKDCFVNGLRVGRGAGDVSTNVAIGSSAVNANTTGARNVGVGSSSLAANTAGVDNVAIGSQALLNLNGDGTTTAYGNLAVGTSAMYRATTARTNTAIGYQALFGSASVTSIGNVSIGYNSMLSNTSGSYNAAIGINALYTLTTGQQNTAVGAEALFSINGSDNSAIGNSALRNATSGTGVTAIGGGAARYKTSSNTNHTSGGTNNIYIGYNSRASGDAPSSEIVIGSEAVGLGSNTAVIGATSQTSATIYGTVTAPGGVNASAYALSSSGINAQTGTTYTLAASDNGKVITMNNASSITVTVPSGLGAGYSVTVIQLGAGQVTFSASGTTINSFGSYTKTAGQHASASLVAYVANTFNLAGALGT